MKETGCYEFNKEKIYRLVNVKDRQGNEKDYGFYANLLNCIAIRLRYDEYPSLDNEYLFRMRMDFVQNEQGQPICRSLHTSVVLNVEDTANDGLKIYTNNSIYILEKAELKAVTYWDDANLIELYMSLADDYYFGKGFYYDTEKKPHELREHVHVGMFQDSVLIHFKKEENLQGCACRYFPMGNYVEFYDTLYKQQDYSTPMLIHNTGKKDLPIRFQMYPHIWTIKPGESKRIIPFNPEGADSEEGEDKTNE